MSAIALKKITSAETKFEALKAQEKLSLICSAFLNPVSQPGLRAGLEDPDSASLRTPGRKAKKGKKAAKKGSPDNKEQATESPR